ncbi:MAG: hypothetical protein WBM62_07785 [Crocosphaera sp.]
MITTINLKITFESLTEAINSLDLPQKQQLLEILEQQIFEDNQYQKRLSIASLWEMSIKVSLNRLELKTTFPNLKKAL